MKEFVISTDSTASLPEDYLKENNIAIHPLHYYIDEEEFGKDIGKELTDKEFYQKIREGKMPTTSATNPDYCNRFPECRVWTGTAGLPCCRNEEAGQDNGRDCRVD